jgi:hypothetical protein
MSDDFEVLPIGTKERLGRLEAQVDALRSHVAEQITFVHTRIADGVALGATVWRLALEDVARENAGLLAELGLGAPQPAAATTRETVA